MADIRKRIGKNGVTYQVRYPSKATKSGYTFRSFNTRKEARAFLESGSVRQHANIPGGKRLRVREAIDRWLEICEKEGCEGRDPVTAYTLKDYRYRASIMKAHGWDKYVDEVTAPDVIEFRSWLLKNCASRDQARKVLSSFSSVLKEMTLRGMTTGNVAAGVSIRGESGYDQPVSIPTFGEVSALLAAADRLANSKNMQVAKAWRRYRPLIYLAADSGMRPQEYLVVSGVGVRDGGIEVARAIERPGIKLSVTKTGAGRRFIDLSPEVYEMIVHYRDNHTADNKHDLVFPTATGHWQNIDNWRNRSFNVACIEAGLFIEETVDGDTVRKPRFTPYALRHFYASVLIDRKVSLKRIQMLMGHRHIETTLNTYAHLLERADTVDGDSGGMLSIMSENTCGKSVANPL